MVFEDFDQPDTDMSTLSFKRAVLFLKTLSRGSSFLFGLTFCYRFEFIIQLRAINDVMILTSIFAACF